MDDSGNETRCEQTINVVDTTPPVSAAVTSPPPNSNGWNSSAVTVSLSATDTTGGSGVREIRYRVNSGTEIVVPGSSASLPIAAEGSTTVTYFAVDNQDNAEIAKSVTVQVDLTDPTISGWTVPAPNPAGWNNSPVTVNFTCSDGLSGVETCTQSQVVVAEGMGQVVFGTATDMAGNSTTTQITVNIDLTLPTVDFGGACPDTVFLNETANVSVSVTDALSGVASQSAPDGPNALDTSTVGDKTFSVEALDVADNSNTGICAYRVIYDFAGAGGFGAPLKNVPEINPAKAGRTFPVKWRLPDGQSGFVSDLEAVESIEYQEVECSDYSVGLGDPVPTDTSGASGLRFDEDTSQYIYNWQTDRSRSGRCYILILTLNDGSEHLAYFSLK